MSEEALTDHLNLAGYIVIALPDIRNNLITSKIAFNDLSCLVLLSFDLDCMTFIKISTC